MTGDLTTLANVKMWLSLATSTTDALLSALITRESRFIQSWLNRNIASQSYTEVRDGIGMGSGRWVLPFEDYPVSAVASLTINGSAVAASADGGIVQPGYGFDARQMWIAQTGPAQGFFSQYGFVRGRRNVKVSYTAGFLVLPDGSTANVGDGLLPAEVHTIPATPYQVTTNFTWISDNGVRYTGGAALTKVASNPATGQYSVDSTGTYTFAAGDVGQSVSLSYSYVPSDLEHATISLVNLRLAERTRPGIKSKTIGNDKEDYSDADMPNDVKTILQQYKKVCSFS